MKFKFSKLGNRICIKTYKTNNECVRTNYVQTFKAKQILKNIKKYNWTVNIEKDVSDIL